LGCHAASVVGSGGGGIIGSVELGADLSGRGGINFPVPFFYLHFLFARAVNF
jgi:hypothetical protein